MRKSQAGEGSGKDCVEERKSKSRGTLGEKALHCGRGRQEGGRKGIIGGLLGCSKKGRDMWDT